VNVLTEVCAEDYALVIEDEISATEVSESVWWGKTHKECQKTNKATTTSSTPSAKTELKKLVLVKNIKILPRIKSKFKNHCYIFVFQNFIWDDVSNKFDRPIEDGLGLPQ
jgi:hypothetical protein